MNVILFLLFIKKKWFLIKKKLSDLYD
jgi:hypothetical protein